MKKITLEDNKYQEELISIHKFLNEELCFNRFPESLLHEIVTGRYTEDIG